MAGERSYQRAHLQQLVSDSEAARVDLRIRWWVLPLALLFCAAQAVLCLIFEHRAPTAYLVSTQISVIAFGLFAVITLLLNPFMRVLTGAEALSRRELVGVFATLSMGYLVWHFSQRPAAVLFATAAATLVPWLVLNPASRLLRISEPLRRDELIAIPAVLLAVFAGITHSQLDLTVTLVCMGTALVVVALLNPALRLAGVRRLLNAAQRLMVFASLCVVVVLAGHSSLTTTTAVIVLVSAVLVSLCFNHILRLVGKVRPLNRAELMALFAAMFVSAGISTFGLVDQLIPTMAAPFNANWNTPQRGWSKDIIPHLNEALYITDTEAIKRFRTGFDSREGLWSKVPWMLWAKPLALWMVFVGAIYLLFYSLTLLFYDTWSRREKLVFPLAQLPDSLMHAEGDAPGSFPPVTRSNLFWIGFLSVVLLLAYNTACQADWIRGMKAIRLGLDQGKLQSMISHSIIKGVADGGRHYLMFLVIFTAVGIGFLLPPTISKSLWVYYLLGVGGVLVAIWSAVVASSRSLPSGMIMENNFLSSMGGGGLLALSVVYLFKLLHEHWAATAESRPASAVDFFLKFLYRLGWGGILFVFSMGVALWWLTWNHVPIHWSMAFLGVLILVTVGLMRVVAEGGVYWFQIHTGPFHLARLAGGAKFIPAGVLAALMPIYWTLFGDIKTFMAPGVMNSFRMREEGRAGRRMYHLIVAASILVTIVAATVTILYLTYEIGANRSSRCSSAAVRRRS